MNVRLSKGQKIQIQQAEDLFKIMQQVLWRENKIRRGQEHCWLIGLNTRSRVLFIELVSLGGTNRVEVTPKEAFRIPIYKLASSVIFVHNHPAGTMKPSMSDKKFTSRMIKAGELIGIKVVDHLIISETEFFSFATNGLMDELGVDALDATPERKKKFIIETKLAAERDTGITIARKLFKKGVDVSLIQEATGLTKLEIEKLGK